MLRIKRFFIVSVLATLAFSFGSCLTNNTSSIVNDIPPPVTTEPPTTASYVANLGMMRGHLIVAKALLDQGTPEQAEPHLGHPVNEIYASVEDQLQTYEVPAFDKSLDEIYSLAKYTPAAPEIKSGYTSSIEAINQAINAVPAEELQSVLFLRDVISEILETAAVEYGASIAKNNKIVAKVEYQDARGFVLYVEELSQQTSLKENQAFNAALQDLKEVFPSVNPPEMAVRSPEEFSSLVDQLISKIG